MQKTETDVGQVGRVLSIFYDHPVDFLSEFSNVVRSSESEGRQLACALVLCLSRSTQEIITPVLEWCITKELSTIDNAHSAFTEVTLHNQVLLSFTSIFGNRFAQAVLASPIQALSKLKRATVTDQTPENIRKVEEVAEQFLNSICGAADEFPQILCRMLYTLSESKFQDGTRSTLFFLLSKLFIPAIIAPADYGMTSDQYQHTSVPITLTKILTAAFRGAQFQKQQTELVHFNAVIGRFQKKIELFATKFLAPQTFAQKTSLDVVPVDDEIFETAAGCFHYYLYWYLGSFADLDKLPRTHVFKVAKETMDKIELIEGKPEPIELPIQAVLASAVQRKRLLTKAKKNTTKVLIQPHIQHIQQLKGSAGSSHVDRASSDDCFASSGGDTTEASQSHKPPRHFTESSDGISLASPRNKTEEFEKKLMASLVYRQMRESQIKQAGLQLQFTYFPNLDDDLWDYSRTDVIERGQFFYGISSNYSFKQQKTSQRLGAAQYRRNS